MEKDENYIQARQDLAKEFLDMWEYELGEGIEDSWFADDDAKVCALNNIRERLIKIIENKY